MSSSSNTVDIKITADTSQAVSGVTGLEKDLRDLGGVLEGELKQKALASADALQKIGAQQGAINTFKELKRETQALGMTLDAAAQAVDKLGSELPQVSAASKALGDAQDKARAEMVAVKNELIEQRAALTRLNADLKAGAVSSDEYKTSSVQLKQAITELNVNFKEKRTVLTAGSQAAAEAAKAEKALTTEYAAALAAARQASAELGNKNRALDTSRAALKAAGVETTGLAEAERKLKTAVSDVKVEVERLAPAFATAANEARRSNETTRTGFDGVGASAAGVAGILRTLGPLFASSFGGQAFIETITSAESLDRSFVQIFGSAQKARAEMEFIKTTSNNLGLETLDLARSYQSLAASTKGTNLEGQATREIFESVSRAMSSLGKSSVETDRALAAVSQMASKGAVAMEELRGQLGEALPGALKAAADGAGITTAQLIKMVESGSVLAEDLLPALTKGLNGLYGNAAPPDTVISNWARFKNVIAETAVEIGEGGASKGLATLLSGTTFAVRGLHAEADVAGTVLGKLAAEVNANGINLDNLQGILREGQQEWEKHKEAIRKSADAVGLLSEAEKAQLKTTTDAKNGTQEYTDALDRRIASETRAAAVTLGTKSAYTEARTEQEKLIEILAKKQEAWNAEAATLTKLVSIYGTEAEKREAAAQAADQQVAAAKAVANSKEVEVAIVQSYLLKLEEERIKTGQLSEAKQAELEKIRLLLTEKKAEAEQSTQLARSKQIEADAAKASAQATQDNSARVFEYRGAMVAAQEKLAELIEKHKRGKATEEDVANGRSKLAAATLLYRDAMDDAVKAAERKIQTDKQAAQVNQAAISVDQERVKAALEVAAANGDVAKQTQLETQATQLAIGAALAKAAADRQEAADIRAKADSLETQAKATGGLTAEIQAQLDAMRTSANLKDLDAQKSDILAEKTRQLASSENARTASLERQITAQEKANDLAERAIALENKRRGIDKEGFATDKSGQRLVAGSDLTTRTGIKAFLKSAGVTDEAAATSITNEFANAKGEIDYYQNSGQRKYGGEGSTISQALLKAAEQYTFGDKQTNLAKAATSPAASTSTVNHVITIPVNGQKKSFSVASDADVATVQAVLASLLSAKSAAGL